MKRILNPRSFRALNSYYHRAGKCHVESDKWKTAFSDEYDPDPKPKQFGDGAFHEELELMHNMIESSKARRSVWDKKRG